MDKILLKFIADVMYIKGIIYFSEYESILDVCTIEDLDEVVERMLHSDFSPYMRGEAYVEIAERARKRDRECGFASDTRSSTEDAEVCESLRHRAVQQR